MDRALLPRLMPIKDQWSIAIIIRAINKSRGKPKKPQSRRTFTIHLWWIFTWMKAIRIVPCSIISFFFASSSTATKKPKTNNRTKHEISNLIEIAFDRRTWGWYFFGNVDHASTYWNSSTFAFTTRSCPIIIASSLSQNFMFQLNSTAQKKVNWNGGQNEFSIHRPIKKPNNTKKKTKLKNVRFVPKHEIIMALELATLSWNCVFCIRTVSSVYVSGQQENNISQISFSMFLNQLHLKYFLWNFLCSFADFGMKFLPWRT